MTKSIYDCECGGYATRISLLLIHYRKCRKCGKQSNAAGTKRQADKNWKYKMFIN